MQDTNTWKEVNMALSPATIDLLIVMITEGISVLAKMSKGEEITDQELTLETWEETLQRVKTELGR
jgi:hypothetical protein